MRVFVRVFAVTGMRCACAIAALLASVVPCSARQTDGGPERARNDLRQYHARINDFRDGKIDAVEWLQSLPHRRITTFVGLIEGSDDPFKPWEKSRFRLAAMMHTDAALQLQKNADPEGVIFHLDIAGRLLRRGGDEINRFASRWYLAVSRWLRDQGSLAAADRYLKLGRDRLPHDPAVLYESGTLAEMVATDYSSRASIDANVKAREERLTMAAGWLRASLQEDGSRAMTRLHLGRVQTLRHEEEDGLQHLHALVSAADPALAYLAALFSGAAYERLGRLDDAAASYRVASARFPLGHAAPVALSEVLQKSGHGDESRAVLQAALVLPRRLGSIREPWWWYLIEPPGVAEDRIVELRKEARR